MPTNSESLNRELYRLLTKYKPKPLDAEGKTTPVPEEADVFKFEFTKDGDDYGTVYVTLDEDRVLTVYFGDDVSDSPSDRTPGIDYDDTWTGLLQQLSAWRMTKGLRGFKTQNKDRVNDDMAKRNHMRNKDKIAEGYYPMGKKASYSDAIPTVKIVIEHSRVIEEGEKRYRNINKIFLENQDGERYLLDTKKPGVARVYARHIAEGGKVNDDRWNHVHSLCEEYSKMAGFVRATRNGQFNESAQSLVNEGIAHYQSLRESLSRMTGKRGYNAYFESWTPPLMEDGTEENNLNELFVQETLDPRIESVMPILNRIHKKVSESVIDKEMNKLAEWADSLVEEESIKSNNPVGIPEGKGDFSQAIEQLSGWDEVEPDEPGTRQYDFDDREGGYYAQGTVVQDLKTGQIKIEFKDDGEYGGHEINDTFNSIGDAMNALRNITTRRSKSGRAQNFDTLGARELTGPDDVYKTDKIGKKGTLKKIRTDIMKASSPYRMRGGPKGVLPEAASPDDPMRPQSKIIKSLRDMAIMSPTLTFQHFRQSGKESVITDAIMAAKQMKSYYQQQGNQGAAQFVYNLENEIDNFKRGYDGNTQDGDTMDLSDLMRGTLSKIQFQTKPGVTEGSHEEQVASLAAYNEKMAGENPPIDLGLREVGNWAKVGHYGDPIKTAWFNIAKYGIRNNKFNDSVDKAMLAIGDFPDKYDLSIPEIDALYSAYETVYDQWEQSRGAANENFINQADQAVVSEEDEMAEGVLDAIKRGVAGAKQFGKEVKDATKQAWDEEIPKLKQDWKNPIKTAFAEEDEMDEGAHTQHYDAANKFTGDIDHGERPPTDWSTDPIEAGTDRIHNKISSMLKKLSKPKDNQDLDEAAAPWEDEDEADKEDDKKPNDKKGSDGANHDGHSRAKHLAKQAIPKEKEEVKEGQDDLDRILTIMNHRR